MITMGLLILLLTGCETKQVKQIKTMMEIGEYNKAIVILNIELNEDVKNVNLREMLLECYEHQRLWNEVIEQVDILNKLGLETDYDFLLMRAYALSNQCDKVEKLRKKYNDYADSLRTQYDKITIEKIKKMDVPSDSLKDIFSYIEANPDTLDEYEKYYYEREKERFNNSLLLEKKYRYYKSKNLKNIEKEKFQFFKDHHLADIKLVDLMCRINSAYVSLYKNNITDILEIDSTYIYYIREPLMKYLSSIEKPNFSDAKYRYISSKFYYFDLCSYHDTRSRVFEGLGDMKAAIDEKLSEFYWQEYAYIDNKDNLRNFKITCYEYFILLDNANDDRGKISYIDKMVKNHPDLADDMNLIERKREILEKEKM